MPNGNVLSIGKRIVLTAAVCSVVGLLIAGLILIHLFHLHTERLFDTAMEDDVIHITSSLALNDDGNLDLVVPLETPLYDRMGSGWAWQLQMDGRPVAQSGSLNDGDILNAPLETGDYFTAPHGVAVRGVARSFEIQDLGKTAVLHVTGSRRGIDAEVKAFRRIAAISLGTLGIVLTLTTLIQVRYGLRPLRRLTMEIQAMRVGESRPDPAGWPAEVSPMVAELNSLQDHNDTLVTRAQRQAADLAHTLKTPLSVTQMIGEEAPAEIREQLLAQVRRMSDALSRNLTRTRSTGGRGHRTAVRLIVDDLFFALSRLLESRRLTGHNLVPEEAVFYGTRNDLEEMLGNLLENAAKWSNSQISVTAVWTNRNLVIEVIDDGPGVPEEQREAIIGRGRRLDETVPGQGMGLSIVAEIVELYEGQFQVLADERGGLCARLSLPGSA